MLCRPRPAVRRLRARDRRYRLAGSTVRRIPCYGLRDRSGSRIVVSPKQGPLCSRWPAARRLQAELPPIRKDPQRCVRHASHSSPGTAAGGRTGRRHATRADCQPGACAGVGNGGEIDRPSCRGRALLWPRPALRNGTTSKGPRQIRLAHRDYLVVSGRRKACRAESICLPSMPRTRRQSPCLLPPTMSNRHCRIWRSRSGHSISNSADGLGRDVLLSATLINE